MRCGFFCNQDPAARKRHSFLGEVRLIAPAFWSLFVTRLFTQHELYTQLAIRDMSRAEKL